MDKIIKIIYAILAALAAFLVGWFAHAWKNRKQITTEVKKTIADLNREHEKALEAMKESYIDKLKKKDEIIRNLQDIIDRLLGKLKPLQGTGAYGVDLLISKLNSHKNQLKNL